MSDRLSADSIDKVDKSDIAADILATPDHLRDALWRAESAQIPDLDTKDGIIVCGMGGSAIGGDLVASAYGDRLVRPVHVERYYGLPSWATGDMAVLCISYSGNTEETLASFEAAGALGAPRVVATTGGELADLAREADVPVIGFPSGLQPRAAVAYSFVSAAEVAARAVVGPGLRSEIDFTADYMDGLRESWGPEVPEKKNLAKKVSVEIGDRPVTIYGADLTVSAARRLKCQMNENAKSVASWSELPEADHNEICGWSGAGDANGFALFLQDSDQHPRIHQRFELTEKIVASSGAGTRSLSIEGDSRTKRLMSLVMLGDLISLYVAVLKGVDPTPVEVIERFKKEL